MNVPRDLAVPFRRLAWRDGQTLASRDLRDDAALNDRLRHLHIRYLHRTFGVVIGLDVVTVSGEVSVTAGYALDFEGCELLLPLRVQLALPATAASTIMYLVISRGPAATGCAPTVDLAVLCPGVTDPVPIETGVVSWKTASEVDLGRDVLLGRAIIASGALASAIDTSIRRRATTLRRPFMWSDATSSGQTGWTKRVGTAVPEIQATVDTSAAGFITMPAYFARLAGASHLAMGYVGSASASDFTFVVRSTDGLTPGSQDGAFDPATAESDGWTIAWLAVAPMGGN
ncbi:MAG TPA: hypothetical protein VK456_11680 [Xanthobacteraceae bacterium]|nr:hypothetical protein [Xanthobacteraceae bacterium]